MVAERHEVRGPHPDEHRRRPVDVGVQRGHEGQDRADLSGVDFPFAEKTSGPIAPLTASFFPTAVAKSVGKAPPTT